MITIIRSTTTIANQARRLGYVVEEETAATGTVYLTLDHESFCDCDGECSASHDRLIRISDHQANDARYMFWVNREPDLDVEVGFQAAAVRRLAQWIGVDPLTLPYLRARATRERKLAEKRAAILTRRNNEIADVASRRVEAIARLTEEERAVLAEYDKTHGKARKLFRRTARYRRVIAKLP